MSSSSRELILTSSRDGSIITYEAATGTVVTRFSGSQIPCRGLVMAGRGLIAASHVFDDTGAGSINVYNWYSSSVFYNFPVPEPVAPLIATSDGEFLFAGGVSGSVFCLSVSSGEVIRSYEAHSKAVSSLHLNDDGSLVISGSEDGTIAVVPTFKVVVKDSTEEDLILHKWKAHSDSVTALTSGMGTLVSCSMDCTCKFWNLGNSGDLKRTVAFPCAIFGVALDSIGLGFHAAGADGLIYGGVVKHGIMELQGGGYEVNAWSKSHGGSIVSLVLLNEGKNLVSAAEDGNVWVWDVEKGEVTMVLGTTEMVSISDMIVAKGIGDFGVRKRNNIAVGDSGEFFTTSGLCYEEMIKTMKQITEIGKDWDVFLQNKKRAIEMLESAIETYERLLKLILKEAIKAIKEEEEEEKDDEKEDE
ncbi:hypothetical protein Fmac_020263 [Flemingia macrophylla]|uniref:Uncharacterized protein n=1 Tax=Flemingia macrophylla TaxID=520843 RepID=A0ABD1LTJ0_9FABA